MTVSDFEWAQNIQQFSWDHARVVDELEKVMLRAYAAVREVAKERKIDFRTAAFVLAVQRVARAVLSRRTIRNPPLAKPRDGDRRVAQRWTWHPSVLQCAR